ncbi:hypothetical protein KFK09_016410 [Dendrobium nobile]|uniref:Phytosulfokine n=1 Tax=Dendrobium nobile TaxID=94219 RepID=A0A8T3B4P0_DENNO|nr:hypothetical protein KFK09_016410 [Dendrobium nobile]
MFSCHRSAMAKTTTLFIFFALILSASLSYAARPNPAEKNTYVVADVGEPEEEVSCEGVGKEECLMRRTLAAHIDYIYTQEKP